MASFETKEERKKRGQEEFSQHYSIDWRKLLSLDPQPDQNEGTTAADLAIGFSPLVGNLQAMRDFERSRREGDTLGMTLSGIGAGLPIAGGMFGMLTKKQIQALAKRMNKPGFQGLTVSAGTGDDVKRGYAVAPKRVGVPKGKQNDFPVGEVTAADIEEMIRKYKVGEKDAFGAWVSDGKVYLDVPTTYDSKFRAIQEGNANNQLAGYDLGWQEWVPKARRTNDAEFLLRAGEKKQKKDAQDVARKIVKEFRDQGFSGSNLKYTIDPETESARKQAMAYLRSPVQHYRKPEGALLDYSSWTEGRLPDMSAFSNIPQDGFLLRRPPKQNIGRLEGILQDSGLHELMRQAAKRGRLQGGDFWYNNSPIYDYMKSLGLPDEEFARWVAQNYSTSSRTSVMPQIAHASLINYGLKHGMFGVNDNPSDIANTIRDFYKSVSPDGKGLQLMEGHIPKAMDFERTKQLITGYDDAQKFSGYGHGLAGFFNPVANDTHEINFLAKFLPKSRRAKFFDKEGNIKLLSPNEYPVMERLYQEIAPALDMTGSPFQSNRWIGGGELTGLRSPPIPFSDAVERLVAWNAKNRGKDAKDLLGAYLSGDTWLDPYRAHGAGLPYAEELLRGR